MTERTQASAPIRPGDLVVHVPDGRVLEVSCTGPPDGMPFVLLHGTPGSCWPLSSIESAVHRRGWRHVGISRPGFGGSTPHPGRTVRDLADDVRVVLAELDADRAVVAGWSGGGPHALACGAVLGPQLVRGVVVIAGCAPRDAEGLDWTAGMSPDDSAEADAAIHDPAALRGMAGAIAAWYRTASGADLVGRLDGRFPDVDVAAIRSCADEFVANLAHGLSAGIDGYLDDWHAMSRPWGFDVGDVRVPVAIWHGGLDSSVPVAHAEWLSRHLVDAHLHLVATAGHLSIGIDHIEEMLDDLVPLV